LVTRAVQRWRPVLHELRRVAVRRMGRRRTVGIAERCRAFPIV